MTILESLCSRIAGMNLKQPFVWRLRITAAEFAALEKAVEEGTVTALQKIVYLAEWYRRCYKGNESRPSALELSEAEVGELWKESGLDAEQFAARYEKKEGFAWTYSTYVLGGLAARFEAGKKDRKFFRQLCRLYYGEELSIAEIADQEGRSVAFRQSVARHQSLYYFIQEVISGSLTGEDKSTNALLDLIKSANDDVLRDKFVIEWIVRYQTNNNYMRRSLRLRLKPEEVGGRLHPYLRYERALAWGIVNPEQVKSLAFAVSFEDGAGHELVKADFDNPVLTCLNAGQIDENRGAFVSDSENVKIEYGRIPSLNFARIRLWVRSDGGEIREVPIKDDKAQGWRQYWCEDGAKGIWTTAKNDRKQTAVLLSGGFDVVMDWGSVRWLPFKDQLGLFSEHFGMCVIREKVTVCDAAGTELATIYNHAGSDKVCARLYGKTICYEQNGLVNCSVLDEDGDDEECGPLPIVFRKEDVLIRHSDAGGTDGECAVEEDVPDKVEFKDGANYREWTDECVPDIGLVTLRVTYRGREFAKQMMLYYPGLFEGAESPQPITRDLAANEIRFRAGTGTEIETIHVDIPEMPNRIEPTREVTLKGNGYLIRVKVHAPTDIKEVLLDGKARMRLKEGERFLVPYILKNRICIHDFGEHGMRDYDCRRLGSIYQTEYIGDQNNAPIIHWKEGRKTAATELDRQAPNWLDVGFGIGKAESETEQGVEYWRWEYLEGKEPAICDEQEMLADLPAHNIAFQNLAADDVGVRIVYPKEPAASKNLLAIFSRPKLASPYRCYCVAVEFNQYFFLFEPLLRLLQDRRDEIKAGVLDPLVNERGGKLKASDCANLLRLAEEGRFDWFDLGVNLAEMISEGE